MSKKTMFRSDISTGLQDGIASVDDESGVINGFAVISKGEAKGHGMEIDDATLDQVVALGNKTKVGSKSRFGHPNMSSTALGTHLGRVRNFRRDGDVVRGDLHLDKTAFDTPNGDLGSYVLELAKSDPDAFGASIAARIDEEERTAEDGTKLKPIARVRALHAVDVVDEPAANDGFFQSNKFFSADVELSAAATEFFDQFLADPDAVDKALGFLGRFSANRADKLKEPAMANDKAVSLDDLDVEQLEDGRPDLVEKIRGGDDESVNLEAEKDSAKSEGVDQERERILGIIESAKEFSEDGVADVVENSIKDGDDQDVALGKMKDCAIGALRTSTPANPGRSEDDDEVIDGLSDEERWERKFNKSPDIQRDFGGDSTGYIAFKKAEKRGAAKVFTNA